MPAPFYKRTWLPPVNRELRTFELVPTNRPKGMLAVRLGPKPDAGDIFKDRAAWLLEALGAYYSHRAGHCLSPAKAEQFAKLYKAGFHASRRLFPSDKKPYTFSLADGPELSLKDALAQCADT